MSSTIKSLRGFNDVLPQETYQWNYVLDTFRGILQQYCIQEIKIPVLEATALFARGVGEATDIVEKEMFSFTSRDDENICLRPEGTAGTIRACLEHGLTYNQEQRLYYFGPLFRYERPQKGRYRQFHQIGVEILGVKSPALDVEVIQMTHHFWRALGIEQHIKLELNTIGTSETRAAFGKALVEYLTPFVAELDKDSQTRLHKNPLRILDSKDARTQEILANAPRLHDFLDDDSRAYFAQVQELLHACGIEFVINEKLVRGLDYYNDTVFEWTTNKLGSQATVCGGGRYDRLVEILGGKPCPGFGFGLGWERLMLLIQETNPITSNPTPDVFIISEPDTVAVAASFKVATQVRTTLPSCMVYNHVAGGKLKKQFAKADKMQAKVVILVYGNEWQDGEQVNIKLLATGEQVTIPLIEVPAYLATHMAK